MANSTTYGSVEDQAEPGEFDEFDEKNTYYVKERPLSREQRIRKCMLASIPILAALLIIGGFATFLLMDFGHLYPTQHGGRNYHNEPDEEAPDFSPRIQHDGSNGPASHSPPSPPAPEKKHKSDMPSSCEAYDKCSGLVGLCCPTGEGTFLDCCN